MARDIDKHYPRRAFIARLRRLADALEREQGFVTQVAGRRVSVPPRALLGVEHEREGGVEELEFQLTWKPARRRRRTKR